MKTDADVLLQETLDVWGKHYQQPLHEEDGKELLSNVSQLFKLLSQWSANT
jgi:hypothetical protein